MNRVEYEGTRTNVGIVMGADFKRAATPQEIDEHRSQLSFPPIPLVERDLLAAGYRLTLREPDWYEHRLFKGPDTNINLHAFTEGSAEIRRMLIGRELVGA